MNNDTPGPVFIKFNTNPTSEEQKQDCTPKQVRRFSWTRFVELIILLAFIIGTVYLASMLITPQVVTVVTVIVAFVVAMAILEFILKLTFTLLRILFWTAIIIAILLCVL